MAVTENTIAQVLQLIPTHPTLAAVMSAHTLRDVPTAEILDALRVLETRGQVDRGAIFSRDTLMKVAKQPNG